jgi:acyl carrier protein
MFRTVNLRRWFKRTEPAIERHATELPLSSGEVHVQSRNVMLEPLNGFSIIEEAANDEMTRRLARIWEKLLGIESVDWDQNYFDLGGDSSLTIQLFVQIEKVFGVKVPVVTLFEAPTVRALAAVIEEAKSSSYPKAG